MVLGHNWRIDHAERIFIASCVGSCSFLQAVTMTVRTRFRPMHRRGLVVREAPAQKAALEAAQAKGVWEAAQAKGGREVAQAKGVGSSAGGGREVAQTKRFWWAGWCRWPRRLGRKRWHRRHRRGGGQSEPSGPMAEICACGPRQLPVQ